MKKLISLFLVFAILFPVIMTAAAPTAFGQTRRVKRCYYTDITVRRVVRKGCNSCARLKAIEERLTILENKKPAETTPVDLSDLKKLREEFDELLPRVQKLEERMDAMDRKTDEIRTDLNAEITRNDDQELRITKLENGCYIFTKKIQDGKKIKTKFFERCGEDVSEVTPDGKGGWSLKKKIIVGGIIIGGGFGLACLFGLGGFCRNKRGYIWVQ